VDVPLGALRFPFEPIPLRALPAELPDHALGPEGAVSAGVGARLAIFETLLTIADTHLLTGDIGFTIRMISACHGLTSEKREPLCFSWASGREGVQRQKGRAAAALPSPFAHSGLECSHEIDQIRLFLRRQFDPQNQIEKLNRVLKGKEPTVM
jgi:hypothetical protein